MFWTKQSKNCLLSLITVIITSSDCWHYGKDWISQSECVTKCIATYPYGPLSGKCVYIGQFNNQPYWTCHCDWKPLFQYKLFCQYEIHLFIVKLQLIGEYFNKAHIGL